MSNAPDDSNVPLPEEDGSPEDVPEATRLMVVSLAVTVEGGLVASALIAGWLFEQHPLSNFDLTIIDFAWGILATIPMLLAFLIMNRWPIGPLAGIKQFLETTIRPFMQPCTRVDLFGISCLAGLGEEMLFRGWAQDLISADLGVFWAIVVASLLFGIIHAVTPTYALLATLLGAFLGWLYVATGNLLAPIVAHALYDFIALWVIVRSEQSQPSKPTDTSDEKK